MSRNTETWCVTFIHIIVGRQCVCLTVCFSRGSVYFCLCFVCLLVCLSASLSVCCLCQHLHEAIESLPPAASPDGESLASQTFSDLLANPVKLQHRLSTDIAEMKAAECLVQASSDQDAARLRSSQGRGAGAWLQAIPSTENYSLKSTEFKIASYLRMGLPLPSSDCVRNCDCGVKLDSLGYHLLTCKFGGGPVWQHNSLVSTWSKCLKSYKSQTKLSQGIDTLTLKIARTL